MISSELSNVSARSGDFSAPAGRGELRPTLAVKPSHLSHFGTTQAVNVQEEQERGR